MTSKLLALTEQEPDFGSVLEWARALREQIDWDDVRAPDRGVAVREGVLHARRGARHRGRRRRVAPARARPCDARCRREAAGSSRAAFPSGPGDPSRGSACRGRTDRRRRIPSSRRRRRARRARPSTSAGPGRRGRCRARASPRPPPAARARRGPCRRRPQCAVPPPPARRVRRSSGNGRNCGRRRRGRARARHLSAAARTCRGLDDRKAEALRLPRLDALDDRTVQAVGDLVREGRPRRPRSPPRQARLVFRLRERTRDAADVGASLCALLRAQAILRDDVARRRPCRRAGARARSRSTPSPCRSTG